MNETTPSGHYPGRTLLFVHGRYFKPAANDLMDISVAAMTAAIERDCPEVIDKFHAMGKYIAYYGDISNEFLEKMGERFDEKLDIGDRRNALQRLRAIEKKKNFGVGRYDRVPGKTAIAEFAADVVGPLLGTLGLSNRVISKIAVDLVEYWNEKSDFAMAPPSSAGPGTRPKNSDPLLPERTSCRAIARCGRSVSTGSSSRAPPRAFAL